MLGEKEVYKRILTVQDVSCVGQCSITVALPILSACGLETAILPSTILSTHTSGFSGYTVRDLTEDMPAILAHWKREGIRFSALYTGYLGSIKQIEYVKSIASYVRSCGGDIIIDPAMADNGALYPAFDEFFVSEMKTLIKEADVILPNLTEACYLTGKPYRTEYDETYIKDVADGLLSLGAKKVVLTGVSYEEGSTGVAVFDDGYSYYKHKKIARNCHGTGDVYASAFTGAYEKGRTAYESAVLAADFTVKCIEKTIPDESHWYGVKFELALPDLIKAFG